LNFIKMKNLCDQESNMAGPLWGLLWALVHRFDRQRGQSERADLGTEVKTCKDAAVPPLLFLGGVCC
jgi:hypothetical protein